MNQNFVNYRDKQKRVLIVNRATMNAGGIETNLADIIKCYLNNGDRVIWLTNKTGVKEFAFKNIIGEKNFIIIKHNKYLKFFYNPKIAFSNEDDVIMLSFTAIDYLVSDRLRIGSNAKSFRHFYVLPNFKGKEFYIDQWFIIIHKIVFIWFRNAIIRLINNHSLLAFNIKHLNKYEEYYNINIKDKDKLLLPCFSDCEFIDNKRLIGLSSTRGNEFKITSCCRFDFPHKGYLIGLLDEFVTLKNNYPILKLFIVGYGAGESIVKDRIKKMPQDFQKDVILKGRVTPEELRELYKESHLVVGLAGAIFVAASCGVPSLIARHYSYDCQVYGFYSEFPNMILSEKEGNPIGPYISKLINMSDEQFIELAKSQYLMYMKGRRVDKDFFNNKIDACSIPFTTSFIERCWIRFLYMIIRLKSNVFKISSY